MYKYQLHIHTTPCSKCGGLTPETLCQALLEYGFQGGVITNHFYHGNSGIERNGTTWSEFVSAYEQDYLACKAEAEKHGLDIIFSIEESVKHGIEILCYGVTPEILYNNPQLIHGELDEWIRVMRENGVVIVQAHPFREADYIPVPGALPFEVLDGVEVFNRGNSTAEMNQKALDFATEHGLIQTSSADAHWPNHIPYGGILTEERITNEKELADLLRSRNFELIIP